MKVVSTEDMHCKNAFNLRVHPRQGSELGLRSPTSDVDYIYGKVETLYLEYRGDTVENRE